MKKFIPNLITVISWIIEIFMWFSIAVCTLMAGSFVFLLVKMPDVIREIAKEPGLRQYSSQFWHILPFFMIIGLIAVIFFNLGIHNVRHLIKNIKQEVYFDQANLHELKQLLIRSIVYTVLSIISWAIILPMDSTPFYPNAYIADLVFIAIVYVVYLIFKHGLALRDDTNKII